MAVSALYSFLLDRHQAADMDGELTVNILKVGRTARAYALSKGLKYISYWLASPQLMKMCSRRPTLPNCYPGSPRRLARRSKLYPKRSWITPLLPPSGSKDKRQPSHPLGRRLLEKIPRLTLRPRTRTASSWLGPNGCGMARTMDFLVRSACSSHHRPRTVQSLLALDPVRLSALKNLGRMARAQQRHLVQRQTLLHRNLRTSSAA